MSAEMPIHNGWEFQLPRRMAIGDLRHANFDFHVYENSIDDFESFDFYFNTWLCDDVDNKELAWTIGNELISLLNGASLVADAEFRKLELSGLFLDGDNVGNLSQHHLAKETLNHGFDPSSLFDENECSEPSEAEVNLQELPLLFDSDKVREILRSQCQHIEKRRDLPQQKYIWQTALIHDAKENNLTYDLLKYFDRGLDWVEMYKIYESLIKTYRSNSHEGLNLSFLEKTDSLANRFRSAANNYQITGVGGRHASAVTAKFSNPPLTLEESRKLIRQTTLAFLEWHLRRDSRTSDNH